MSGAEPIVALTGVGRTVSDGVRRRTVLKDVSLAVSSGEMIALTGASGCGKTTLLNIIGALDADYEGEVRLLGRSLRGLDDDARTRLRNGAIGFVFQAFHLLEHLTVGQNVEVPLWLLPGRLPRAEAAARARAALDRVGLGERCDESVRPLSGGERQRVAIARAIVNRPRLLLADEPTGNLDRETGERIYDLFDTLRRSAAEGSCAVVVATHDLRLADKADRTFGFKDGRLAGGGAAGGAE